MATLEVCLQMFVCVFHFDHLKAKKKQLHSIVRCCVCVCDLVLAYMHSLPSCLLKKAVLIVQHCWRRISSK